MNNDYPVFANPQRYLRVRVSSGPLGRMKIRSEHRALDRCLSVGSAIRAVLDVPCGPGRLFPYWAQRRYSVYACDLSEEMVEYASKIHSDLGLVGSVTAGDAFEGLPGSPSQAVDLIACVRFAYYFESEERIALLRALALRTGRYLLVQYKTNHTWRGSRHDRHFRDQGRYSKHFTTVEQALGELREAGLSPLRVEPISEFSDRMFIIAERTGPDASLEPPEVVVSGAPYRWPAALLRVFDK
jgi:SAM-dependent methyltransferase